MEQQRTLVLEPKMKYEIKPLCTSHQFSAVLQGPKGTDFWGGFEVSFKLSEDVSVSQYFGTPCSGWRHSDWSTYTFATSGTNKTTRFFINKCP